MPLSSDLGGGRTPTTAQLAAESSVPRATRDAMWIGDNIFFNSDRDGHFNLYAYNVSSGGRVWGPDV